MPDQTASMHFTADVEMPAIVVPALSARPRPRRLGRVRTFAAILLGMTVLGGNAVTAWMGREHALADAGRELRHVSYALADQTDRAVQAVEGIQAVLVERIRAAGIATPAELRSFTAGRAVQFMLRERNAAVGRPDAVTLFDAEGRPLGAPGPAPAPVEGLTSRAEFQALASGESRFIGRPVLDAATGTWTLHVAHRISGPEGEFLGMALGVVDLSHLARLHAEQPWGMGGSLHIFAADGTPLLRYPSTSGEEAPGLVAGHASGAYPLLVQAEVTERAALSAWRLQAGALGGSTALVLLLAGLAGAASARRGRVQADAEEERRQLDAERARMEVVAAEERLRHRRELAAQDTEFQATIESMTQGVIKFGPHAKLVLANCRCAEILGFPLEALRTGATLAELGIAAREAGQADAAAVLDRLLPLVVRREAGAFQQEMEGGRAVSVVHKPLRGGGWLATFEDVSARHAAEMRVAHLADHDALTGLPNRAMLRERLASVIASADCGGGRTSVLHINLDRFRTVNETLGHRVGDTLLRAVAGRIMRQVRAHRGGGDIVARLGADEFAVVTAPAFGMRGDAAAEAAGLARRIVAALSRPFEVDGFDVVIGASVGIALFPADGATADEMLRHAELALHGAKADGRGRYVFFEPEMGAQAQGRRLLELDLRRALTLGKGREFELHYQPVVDVMTRRVSGLEALLRWTHPVHGMVPAGTFISLADELGLIVPLGKVLLHRACAEVAQWSTTLRVALNLSSSQVLDPGLVDSVAAALDESGLNPHRLELEITEAVLLQAPELTLNVLHRLRAMGVRVTMDDFGTGASSLGYLRSFPFDKVKIDRSFVAELGGRSDGVAIVQAITSLCGRLGIPTTAEGVETEEQLRLLAAQRCVQAQGHLFSPPVPAAEVPFMLSRLGAAALAAQGIRVG
jgi:diguanylate cyclase (GGDEF)-like protein